MEVISEKKTICTAVKIFYKKDENFYIDIEQRKKDGWSVVKKANWYNERFENIIKTSSNGFVITYQKYEPIVEK